MATIVAPSPFAVIQTRGSTYTADAQGHITATNSADIQDLTAVGCVYASQLAAASGSSLPPSAVSATGTTQGAAAPLSATFSVITAATVNFGVVLAPLTNQLQIIYNAGSNAANIWPTSGMAIGSAAANAPMGLAPGRAVGIVVANSAQAYPVFNSSSFG